MNELSAVVITCNEEKNIDRCLGSLGFASEIVVVDSGSEDRTPDLASKYTDRVFRRDWEGYAAQKNFGIDQARGPWILWLDADEEITPELASEISDILSGNPEHAGYTMPRTCRFMGRWIRHGNWYPDRTIRLFLKEKGRFGERMVHESVQIEGSVSNLNNHILHYSFPDLEEYFTKFNRYTTLDAEERFKEGKGASILSLLTAPAGVFLKSYIAKRGFLDGLSGLTVAVLSGFYVFVKKLKLLERTWHQGSS
ncbi:glycosyltransferase family 2 protein [Acidobacteriota bacterium]